MKNKLLAISLLLTLWPGFTISSAQADVCVSGAGTAEWNGTYAGPGSQGEFVLDGSHMVYPSGTTWFFSSAIFAFPYSYISTDMGNSPVGLTYSAHNGASLPGPTVTDGGCIAPTPTSTPTPLPTATPTVPAVPTPPERLCIDSKIPARRVLSGTYSPNANFEYSDSGKPLTLKPFPSSSDPTSWIIFVNALTGYRKPGVSPVGTYGKNYFVVAAGACSNAQQPGLPQTDTLEGLIGQLESAKSCLASGKCAGSASLISENVNTSSSSLSSRAGEAIILQTVPVAADGSYKFTGVPSGNYTVSLKGDGISFNPSSIQVTVVAGVPATAQTVTSNGQQYRDEGCSLKNKSTAVKAANSAASAIHTFINDQLGIISAQARAGIPAKNFDKFIRPLLNSQTRATQLLSRILASNNATPLFERSKCPASNQCTAQNLQKDKKASLKNLSALTRIGTSVLAKSRAKFNSRSNLQRVKNATKKLEGLLAKAQRTVGQLSSKNQSCPIS